MSLGRRKRSAPDRFSPSDWIAAKVARTSANSTASAPATTRTTSGRKSGPRTSPSATAAAAGGTVKSPRAVKSARVFFKAKRSLKTNPSPSKKFKPTAKAPNAPPASHVRDAAALRNQFVNTIGQIGHIKGNKSKVSLTVLPDSKISRKYEQKAAALDGKTVVLLDRSQPPAPVAHASGSGREASEVGTASEYLAFHGTPERNIGSIIQKGFRKAKHAGMHGKAIYTTNRANYAHGYTLSSKPKTSNTIIGCRVLAYQGEIFGHAIAARDPLRVLPVCLIHY
jgi:Poly(ADP-ribose) polymerase catalytic domain